MVSVGPPLSASGPSLGSGKESPPAGVFEAIRVFTNGPHAVPPQAVPLIPLGPGAPGYWPVPPAPPAPPEPPLPRVQATVQLMRLHVPSTPPKPEPRSEEHTSE